MAIRLFVGNLVYSATEAEIRELFTAVGTVSQVRIPVDRDTGKTKGFAFVDFEERAQAEEAIRRFNQHTFQDRAISVSEARTRESRAGGAAPGGVPAPRPRPSSVRGPAWHGPLASAPGEGPEQTHQPRRTFGPKASARDQRRQKGRASREERGPKGTQRERGGWQGSPGADFEEPDDDPGADDFARWAREDASNHEEE